MTWSGLIGFAVVLAVIWVLINAAEWFDDMFKDDD